MLSMLLGDGGGGEWRVDDDVEVVAENLNQLLAMPYVPRPASVSSISSVAPILSFGCVARESQPFRSSSFSLSAPSSFSLFLILFIVSSSPPLPLLLSTPRNLNTTCVVHPAATRNSASRSRCIASATPSSSTSPLPRSRSTLRLSSWYATALVSRAYRRGMRACALVLAVNLRVWE